MDASKLAIRINANPVFEAGGKNGNLRIENIPQNRYDMVVSVTLDDTGETIYRSPLIHPNQYVEYADLGVSLGSGIYRATALFEAFDSDGAPAGRVQAGIKITIS